MGWLRALCQSQSFWFLSFWQLQAARAGLPWRTTFSFGCFQAHTATVAMSLPKKGWRPIEKLAGWRQLQVKFSAFTGYLHTFAEPLAKESWMLVWELFWHNAISLICLPACLMEAYQVPSWTGQQRIVTSFLMQPIGLATKSRNSTGWCIMVILSLPMVCW